MATLTMQVRWGKRELTDASGNSIPHAPSLERLVSSLSHGTTLIFTLDGDGRAITIDGVQAHLGRYLPLLDDEAVFLDQRLLLARAEQNEKTNPASAIADLSVMFERHAKLLDVPYVRRVFNALSDEVRLGLVEPLRSWVATRGYAELDDTKFDLSWWSESQLVKLSNKLDKSETKRSENFTLEAVIAELARRGSKHATRATKRANQKVIHDEALSEEWLQKVLQAADARALAVTADALQERHHPYGEFLALHLAGTPEALEQAKTLARKSQRSWLGPLAALLGEVTYVRGLPVAATVVKRPARGFDLFGALAHPLAATLEKVVLDTSAATSGDSLRRVGWWRDIVATLLNRGGLKEIDCVCEALPACAGLARLSQVTHLHRLEVDELTFFAKGALPAVTWVQPSIRAGARVGVLTALLDDGSGLLRANRPTIDLHFVNGCSEADREHVREVAPRLAARAVLIDGVPLEVGAALPRIPGVQAAVAANPGRDRIEEAPTGRSLCRTCDESIAKGVMRFAEEYEDMRGDSAVRFHHLTCAASSKLGPRVQVALGAITTAIPDRANLEALLAAPRNRGK